MPDEPSWEDIFRPTDIRPTGPEAHPETAGQPATRREARQAQRARRPSSPRARRGRARRGRGWLWTLLAVLALLAGGAAVGWAVFGDRISDVLGLGEPQDYTGQGNGEPIDITITSGQIGEDVARTLVEADVVKSFSTFYDLLLEENPTFTPGTYSLQKQMSSRAALDALLDSENRIVSRVAVREGVTVPTILELLSAGTGIAVADFEAALADAASFGLPADLPNPDGYAFPGYEGYLFPATYQFDPGLDAHSMLQQMIDRTIQELDAAGVAAADRHRVLTIASLIQREAGSDPDDFYRVSRVIQNRLDEGMLLQLDSTVHYGANSEHGSVFTTDEERAAQNPYNTYVVDGLPIGPIAAPGALAIDAALHPADGEWLYFVTVNLETGQTVFSTTLSEHNQAVEQLQAYCRENDC